MADVMHYKSCTTNTIGRRVEMPADLPKPLLRLCFTSSHRKRVVEIVSRQHR